MITSGRPINLVQRDQLTCTNMAVFRTGAVIERLPLERKPNPNPKKSFELPRTVPRSCLLTDHRRPAILSAAQSLIICPVYDRLKNFRSLSKDFLGLGLNKKRQTQLVPLICIVCACKIKYAWLWTVFHLLLICSYLNSTMCAQESTEVVKEHYRHELCDRCRRQF